EERLTRAAKVLRMPIGMLVPTKDGPMLRLQKVTRNTVKGPPSPGGGRSVDRLLHLGPMDKKRLEELRTAGVEVSLQAERGPVSMETLEEAKRLNLEVSLEAMPHVWPPMTNWPVRMRSELNYLVPILGNLPAGCAEVLDASSGCAGTLIPLATIGVPVT